MRAHLVMRMTMNFLPEPASVAACRRFVEHELSRCPKSFVDGAVLATSELVTNSILHGNSGGELAVEFDRSSVRIEVSDDSSEVPIERAHGPTAEHGRGIPIVAALADAWGVSSNEVGKTVWMSLAVPR
jgi:anti-sigma regulatory factor (Ser/Thr protein kinase)